MTWRVFTDPGYIIGSGLRPGELRRIFITLNGTDAKYTIQNPIVETGDFRHSYLVAGGAGTFGRLSGNAASFDNEFRINNTDDSIAFKFGGGSGKAISLDSALDRTKFNEIVMSRSGSTVSIEINGTTQSATATDSGTYTTDVLGVAFTSFNIGIIADVDLGNGNAWQLNRLTANTEQSSSGNNLLTYVNIDADARELFTFNQSEQRWVGILRPPLTSNFGSIEVDGTLISGTRAAFNFLTLDFNYVQPESEHAVSITNSDFTGELRIRDGTGDLESGITGDCDFVIIPTDGTFVISAGATDFDGKFNIEVKRIIEIA